MGALAERSIAGDQARLLPDALAARQLGCTSLPSEPRGTTVEYYDFSVYAMAASLALGPRFFPSGSATASTLAAFATFAAAFIARPVGSSLFSSLGDRVGRRRSLLICLLLMCGAVVAIGLLLTYGTAGVIAPVLLVVCRLLQGLAVGGELGGAVLLATEHAPPARRALFGAFPADRPAPRAH